MLKLSMDILSKIKSYLLPIGAILIIPAAIIYCTKGRLSSHVIFVILGLILFVLGLTLLIITIRLLERIGKGTLAPWNPTKKLVIEGPYKYIRNPMITGVLIMLLGISSAFLSLGVLIWVIIFFAINTVYFFLSEEKGLIKRFGNEYLEYRRNVPMWFPKIKK